MTKDQVAGIARAVLSAFGGYLVGKGVVDADTASQLVGAGATIAAAIWSVVSKRAAA